MIKAWEVYYSRTLKRNVVVVDDDNLKDTSDIATVRIDNPDNDNLFTVISKSDLY